MSKIILFTDLDDTLFTSYRKSPPAADFQPVAYLKDGSAISYCSPQQQTMLALWQSNSLVIPVTARNLDSFKRVDIAFQYDAIIDFGGVILNKEGKADEKWLARSKHCAQESTPYLHQLAKLLAQKLPQECYAELNIRLISDLGITFYLLIKSQGDYTHNLQQVAERLRPLLTPEYQLNLNANNLVVLPVWLNKASAVQYLQADYRQKYGQFVSLGMGDSLSDLAFMQCCDYWITPQTSQISAQII